MKLVRQFEQRIDGLLDGLAARVFSGPLHPSELATRLIRTADLSLTDAKVAHNVFRIVVGDAAGSADSEPVVELLEQLVEDAALERGWRLDGPARVTITIDPEARRGSVWVSSAQAPGVRPAWAVLRGSGEQHAITVNRAMVGRGADCDVVIGHDQISRHHAVLWADGGKLWIADSGSSNGTAVDGRPVTSSPEVLEDGSVVRLADLGFRFELVR